VGKVILKVWVKKLFLDANIRPTKRSVKEVKKMGCHKLATHPSIWLRKNYQSVSIQSNRTYT
jgi:hypothetical protein